MPTSATICWPASSACCIVAVDDDELVGFWAARHDLYALVGRPVLVRPEMKSNAQPGAHFQLVVFDGPLEVDWNIGPLSQARRPASSRILLQRAEVAVMAQPRLSSTERLARLDHQLTFFWAMAPIAVKYIGRAQSRRAVGQLGLLTGAALQALNVAIPSEMPTQVSRLALLAEAELRSRRPPSAADLE